MCFSLRGVFRWFVYACICLFPYVCAGRHRATYLLLGSKMFRSVLCPDERNLEAIKEWMVEGCI